MVSDRFNLRFNLIFLPQIAISSHPVMIDRTLEVQVIISVVDNSTYESVCITLEFPGMYAYRPPALHACTCDMGMSSVVHGARFNSSLGSVGKKRYDGH